MAESSRYSALQPQQLLNSRGKNLISVRGHFVSVGELDEKFNDPMNVMSTFHTNMKMAIAKCKPHDFQHMRVAFPVETLQHVTVRSALQGILETEGFIPRRDENEQRPGFKDLTFWSAVISGEDIEKGRQQAADNVRRAVTPGDVHTHDAEIQKQFASSPAFNELSSRYGQYKFSFPLSHLLALYGDQFCQGETPQFRILGSEVYRQEIAHYIVVHGPDTDLYKDLPMVPTVKSQDDSLDFVYMKDNKLYWRPESTSDHLYVKILKDGSVSYYCYNPDCPYMKLGICVHIKDGIYGPWNHLGFAFHIPPGNHLNISTQDLLDHVTTCKTISPYLGKEVDPDPDIVLKDINDEWSK